MKREGNGMSEKRESYHDYMGRRLREESDQARSKLLADDYPYPYNQLELTDIINDLKKRIEILENLERKRNANL